MANSLVQIFKKVDLALINHFNGVDVLALPRAERELVEHIRRTAADLKLDIRDYELAETRPIQLKYLKDAKTQSEQLRASILKASGYGMFGAADVAQLTATLEQASERLI